MKESITDLMAQYHGQLTDLAERLQTELTRDRLNEERTPSRFCMLHTQHTTSIPTTGVVVSTVLTWAPVCYTNYTTVLCGISFIFCRIWLLFVVEYNIQIHIHFIFTSYSLHIRSIFIIFSRIWWISYSLIFLHIFKIFMIFTSPTWISWICSWIWHEYRRH